MKKQFEQQLHAFGFGRSYIHDYLEKRVAALGAAEAWKTADSLEEFCERSPSAGAYARYVASTLWQGANIAQNLKGYLGSPHRRMLDVGCGFGGSLVAFAKLGFAVTGVELDGERAAAARSLLLDQRAVGEVHSLDVYSERFVELGKFDVVIAENVVEHVDDPRAFLGRLTSCLHPHGIIYLEVPNARGVQYVAAEPHYGLPLIGLLNHHTAKAAFQAVIGSKDSSYRYEVGEYYPLHWYESVLSDLRFEVQSIPHPHATRSLTEFASLITKIVASAEDVPQRYAQCDVFLRDELRRAAWKFLSHAASAFHEKLTGACPTFERDFLADAWVVVGRSRSEKDAARF